MKALIIFFLSTVMGPMAIAAGQDSGRLPLGFGVCKKDTAGREGVLTVMVSADRRCSLSIASQGHWQLAPGRGLRLYLTAGYAIILCRDRSGDPEWPYTDTLQVTPAMLGKVVNYQVHFGDQNKYANQRAIDTLRALQAVDDSDTSTTYYPDVNNDQPSYEEGEAAMYVFIAQHLSYPSGDKQSGTEGKVLLRLDVDTLGAVRDVSVEQSVSPGLDTEARRVVSMLKFVPAHRNGMAIKSSIEIPVIFKL